MATNKQKAANRANAQKSTGPKSEAGKSVARMNANKHGLTAKTIVIGDEDPKAFDALRAQLEAEFNPRPGLEADLVERLAINIWRMRRMPVFEAAIIALGCERAASKKRQGDDSDACWDIELKEVPFEDIALGLIQNQDMLQNLSRYETSLSNANSTRSIVSPGRRAQAPRGGRAQELWYTSVLQHPKVPPRPVASS